MSKKLRNPGHCTMCSKELPQSKRGWGMIWDDGVTGVCAKCLYDMRVKIGYFEREDRTLAPKTRKPSKNPQEPQG
jgi:hypothetical protein